MIPGAFRSHGFWVSDLKNKWVLAAILAAVAILMYLSVFWKMSEYGPG